MIELPRVNPVGVSEIPDEFVRTPRRHPLSSRVLAGVLAVTFTAVVLATGVMSLATWCLTSDAGAPYPFWTP